MEKSVVEIEVRAVLPTSAGSAVFLGNDKKVFVIYVDQFVGTAITMFIHETPKPRPQTHDLFGDVLLALGAKVERIVINDFQDGVYFARLIIAAENEIEERKVIEVDGRPSDCIALAVQQKAPIYISSEVWESVEDMSVVLQKMEEKGLEQDDNPPDPDFPGL